MRRVPCSASRARASRRRRASCAAGGWPRPPAEHRGGSGSWQARSCSSADSASVMCPSTALGDQRVQSRRVARPRASAGARSPGQRCPARTTSRFCRVSSATVPTVAAPSPGRRPPGRCPRPSPRAAREPARDRADHQVRHAAGVVQQLADVERHAARHLVDARRVPVVPPGLLAQQRQHRVLAKRARRSAPCCSCGPAPAPPRRPTVHPSGRRTAPGTEGAGSC